ncbi:MAG TPA: TRAP transporter small permease [Syntrophorhabdaceae bacterium]|nr:TRAP transporter small permease [Syntrophorhabdaceae bacterium]
MGGFERFIYRVSNLGGYLAEFFIAMVVILVVATVVGRALGVALPGAFDLVETFIVVGVSFSLVKAEMADHHTKADVLVKHLSKRGRAWVETINQTLSLFVWAVIVYASYFLTVQKAENHEMTEFLKVPIYPFRAAFTVASFLFCIVLLIKVVHHIKQGVSK